MTVENTSNKKRVQGDGATDEVNFTFRVIQAADLKVYVYPDDLAFDDLEDYLLDPDTDYTVDLDDDGEGGTITLDTAPDTDEICLVINVLDLTQTADLPTETNFNEETVEIALDRLVMQNIQQQEAINRCIKLSVEDPLNSDSFEDITLTAEEAEDRAGKVIIWNDDGDGLETGPSADDIDAAEENAESAEAFAIAAGDAADRAEAAADELGTISSQDADDITVTGGSIDGTAIGSATPAAGTFSSLKQSSTAPEFISIQTDVAADTGWYGMANTSSVGTLTWRTKTDANGAGTSFWQVTRSGTSVTGQTHNVDSGVHQFDGGVVQAQMGTGSGNKILIGTANVNTTAVGNVGAGEDNLMTYAMPTNSMTAALKGVRITAWGVTANNANPKTLKLYFGSLAILTTALTINQVGVWRAVAEVISTGTDAQSWISQLVQGGGTTLVDAEQGTHTQDDGAAITIKCTGTVTDGGGGINNDDLVQKGMIVEFLG